MDNSYQQFLAAIKIQIGEAQVRVVTAANSQMLLLYWSLGQHILQHQSKKGWGAKIIDLLAKDLKTEFPKLKGFSVRNLKYMRKFALDYPPSVIEQLVLASEELRAEETSIPKVQKILKTFVQQVAAQMQSNKDQKVQLPAAQKNYNELFLQSILARITWSHHLMLMDKVTDIGHRLWYMLHVIEHGVSRNILSLQIEGGLFERQIKSKKITNFERTLPPPHSEIWPITF